MPGLPSPPIKGISLLFLKVADVLPPDSQHINGLDIIYALEKVTGRGTIEGAQRMGNLFRIYIKNESARNKLRIEGFTFNDHLVSLFSNNPFSVKDQSSETVKIIIGGVPLSVSNEEFEKALLDLNVQLVSDIKFENYRDSEGKWTNYKTGRRFVYCKNPTLNLKPYTKVGLWNASIYYRGQIRPVKSKPQNGIVQVDSTEVTTSTESKNATSSTTNASMPSVPPHVPASNNDGVGKSGVSMAEVAKVRRDQISTEINDTRSPILDKGKGGRGKAQANKKGESSVTSPSASRNYNAAPPNRGRAPTRKSVSDPKQSNISKLFIRKISTSNPRNKRVNDTSPQSPLPSKSNARSKSYHTDWFEETGDPDDLC